jgi:ABC-type histidine transport system ATPase subunit
VGEAEAQVWAQSRVEVLESRSASAAVGEILVVVGGGGSGLGIVVVTPVAAWDRPARAYVVRKPSRAREATSATRRLTTSNRRQQEFAHLNRAFS